MKKKPVIIAVAVVVVAIIIFLNVRSNRTARTVVQVSELEKRNIEKVVTASGTIEPKRRVNVSASAIGKVTRLAVEEGQQVTKGDFLLEIDPADYQSAVDQLEAGIRAGEANLDMQQASLTKAKYDFERARELHTKGFASEEELKSAEVTVDINQARVRSARESLSQQQANLKKARHDLDDVRITAEMSGIITALNVEEGESAIMGTLNNPGTVLLTIADLSEMEAEVQVDETEVIYIKVGQKATVALDAYPDTTFTGLVTEVGNSAIRSLAGLGQESVDFKVVIAITDSIPGIRPGLSASVDITVAEVKDGLAIPIQCLTIRKSGDLRKQTGAGGPADSGAPEKEVATDSAAAAPEEDEEATEIEGVFVVEEDIATFKEIKVGIAGDNYFHVKQGLTEGEQVISGPFKVISEIRDGDPVKIRKKSTTSTK